MRRIPLQNQPVGRPRRPIFTPRIVTVDFAEIERRVAMTTLDKEVLSMVEIINNGDIITSL